MKNFIIIALTFALGSAIDLQSNIEAAQTGDCNCGSECNASADLTLDLGNGAAFPTDFCISTAQYFACCNNPCDVECDCTAA